MQPDLDSREGSTKELTIHYPLADRDVCKIVFETDLLLETEKRSLLSSASVCARSADTDGPGHHSNDAVDRMTDPIKQSITDRFISYVRSGMAPLGSAHRVSESKMVEYGQLAASPHSVKRTQYQCVPAYQELLPRILEAQNSRKKQACAVLKSLTLSGKTAHGPTMFQ